MVGLFNILALGIKEHKYTSSIIELLNGPGPSPPGPNAGALFAGDEG
jgi:hypothetical protein